MKASLKTLSLVSALLALLATSCASHHDRASTPPQHFYCHMCDFHHPYHHAHYRVYYSDDYRYHRAPATSRSTVVVKKPPGLPPPPPGDPLRKLLP